MDIQLIILLQTDNSMVKTENDQKCRQQCKKHKIETLKLNYTNRNRSDLSFPQINPIFYHVVDPIIV